MFPEEQKDEVREELKKTKANHEAFTLLVALGGLVLLGLAGRFPNVEWSAIGVLWFIIVSALGLILR